MMNPPKVGDRCPYCEKGEIVLPSQLGMNADDYLLLCDHPECYHGYNFRHGYDCNLEWAGIGEAGRKPSRMK